MLTFRRPQTGCTQKISVITFTDAARPNERPQLCILSRLVIGEVKEGSLFHPIGWASFLSGSPVKSNGAGETFADGEGSDKRKQLAAVFSHLLGIEVCFLLVTDSKSILRFYFDVA